ncbi:shikimate kinase [Blattabacterium cuenoti]|uniref:shikimate kinase n=1 Tax=Blattabacterium cuenoti TaxID=1653831 RepID=UPI00163BE1F6|nr:shikimate kinase [Blattabacterium cuenoti]
MKITLIGYMGSGKSSLGAMLAKKLNIIFYDLDSIISKTYGISIFSLFKRKGEFSFRKIEHLMLKKILKKKHSYILSVGGGTPCFYKNIYLLNKYSKTIYIKIDAYTLFNRLILEKEKRPLIFNFSKKELYRFIMKHLLKRVPFYEQASIKIEIDKKKSKTNVIKEIIKSIYSDT